MMNKDLLQRIAATLEAYPGYRALHHPGHLDNGHLGIDEGEFRIRAYLEEFIGRTGDPRNSEDKRFSNDRGTVAVSDQAIALLGSGTVEDATRRLEAINIGGRVAMGTAQFYLRLDVDDLGRLRVDRARDC